MDTMYGALQRRPARRGSTEIREAGPVQGRARDRDAAGGARRAWTDGGEVLNLCANNYLGLADHPAIVAAAQRGARPLGLRHGVGALHLRHAGGCTRSSRSGCRAFLGTEDTILYGSCFDANGGLFETLLGAEDAVISDELNHASIIDGIRLCKAQRLRYANGDMDELEAQLREAAGARRRLIATDGVFSMDGYIADARPRSATWPSATTRS